MEKNTALKPDIEDDGRMLRKGCEWIPKNGILFYAKNQITAEDRQLLKAEKALKKKGGCEQRWLSLSSSDIRMQRKGVLNGLLFL